MDLVSVMKIAGSGMKAQSSRLKIVSENVANADSLASTPGGDPYRRKTVSFKQMVDRETGANLVKVDRIGTDRSQFPMVYEPHNPVADAQGYVKRPNVSTLIEMADMREASRSYEANLNMLDAGRSMYEKTINMLGN